MRQHPWVLLLVRWGINALGVFLAASIIPGIDYRDTTSLVIVAVLLGLFNAFLKPLLVFFALPFVVVTLGFGILLINAFLLMLAAELTDGFEVSGFLAAFFGALVISLVNLGLGRFVEERPHTAGSPRPHRPGQVSRTRRPKDDDVIDV